MVHKGNHSFAWEKVNNLKISFFFPVRRKKMKNLREIKKVLLEHKEELMRGYKITEIGIFGSFVRGEQKKKRCRYPCGI
jgi:hypothetical protein